MALVCREVGRGDGLRGRSAARAEDAQETPTHSHISPSILVYEGNDAEWVKAGVVVTVIKK